MKILNSKSIKGIKIGEFTNKWYFEIRKDSYCTGIEIKGFGLHLRWYIGKHFFFIRSLENIDRYLIHS